MINNNFNQHANVLPSSLLTSMERSILAESFVPAADRAMNERQATCMLQPQQGLPTLSEDCNRLRNQLCPSIPLSAVHRYEFGQSKSFISPARILLPDLYFAVEHRKKQLMSNGKSIPNAPDIPHVENISDLKSYCETFEKLLMEERKQVLLCYERYSQYKHYIKIPKKTRNAKAKPCWIYIEGITDARPNVQIGDIILIRPDELVWLPHPNLAVGGYMRQPQVLEVQLQCMEVERHPTGNDRLLVTWLDTQAGIFQAAKNMKSAFNTRLIPDPKQLVRCLTAIAWLATISPPLAMSFLYPTEAPMVPTLSPQTTLSFTEEQNIGFKLNTNQSSFVRCLWQRTQNPSYKEVRGPLILTGPAGTGKTKTLLCAILQILTLNTSQSRTKSNTPTQQTMRILVCTPSHTAADVVTQRLGKHLNSSRLFRLYDADRPVNAVPPPVLPFCYQNESSGRFVLPAVKDLLQFEVIVCTCLDAAILYLAGMTNQQLRHHRKHLEHETKKSFEACGINVDSISGSDNPHFTHLFIDEAAQATEPESLITLSATVDPEKLVRKVEIALVGDPRQLSPEVYSAAAANAGLNKSWIERLLQTPITCLGGGNKNMLGPEMMQVDEFLKYSFQVDGQEQLSTFLTLNYRGHPSFLAMPSALFYSDKLQSAFYDKRVTDKKHELFWYEKLRKIEALSLPVIVSVEENQAEGLWRPQKQFDFPIHFRGVIGKDVSVTINSGFTSNSWKNHEEAAIVVETVMMLTKDGVSSRSIGVMAPFRGQVVLIRKLLRDQNLGAINVGTIEDYQGVERDVIVLSLTRSSDVFVRHDIQRRIGVFGQFKRSNVALTRAENLFVVVGNPEVMKCDPVWEQWLLFCLRNGIWYGDNINGRLLSSNEEDIQFVRRLPGELSRLMDETAEEKKQQNTQFVTVSSIERMLRTTILSSI